MDQLFQTCCIESTTGPGTTKYDIFISSEEVEALAVTAAGATMSLHIGSVQTHLSMRAVWAALNGAFPDTAWRVTFAFE